jgi:CHAD domain-containing protein
VLQRAAAHAIGVADRKVLDDVAQWIAAQREDAQESMDRVALRYLDGRRGKLRGGRRALLALLKVPDLGRRDAADASSFAEPTFASLARAKLPQVFDDFAVAAGEDLSCPNKLHRLRIRGKRVRYALEVFRPCVSDGFTSLYAVVEDLQERLGEINDAYELVHCLQNYCAAREHDHAAADPSWLSTIEGWVHRYEQKRDGLIDSFLSDWQRGQWRGILEREPHVKANSGRDSLDAVSEPFSIIHDEHPRHERIDLGVPS